MTNKVLIVTDPGMGWDCILGVFKDVSKEELEKQFPNPTYVVFEETVEKFVKEHWD